MIDSHVQLSSGERSLDLLDDALEFTGMSGVIAVQTDASGLANHACLDLVKASEGLVCGMVAWAPLADERLMRIQLDADSREPLVLGYHAHLGNTDVREWVADEDVAYGIEQITERDIPLDIILSPDQLSGVLPVIDAHPSLRIVLDHCLGTAAIVDDAWARLIREIGRRPQVYYRLSGLSAGLGDEPVFDLCEKVKPAFALALESFGAQRLLYGSGWPNNAAKYPTWLNVVDSLIAELSEDERLAIYGENAEDVYRFC